MRIEKLGFSQAKARTDRARSQGDCLYVYGLVGY